MAWRVPKIEDLATTLSRTELDGYSASASLTGADPLELILTKSADFVRGYCRANKSLSISPAASTIPESLMASCMDYAAFQVLKRMPVGVTETRLQAYQDALKVFAQVASGALVPESCEDADAEPASIPLPSFADPNPSRALDCIGLPVLLLLLGFGGPCVKCDTVSHLENLPSEVKCDTVSHLENLPSEVKCDTVSHLENLPAEVKCDTVSHLENLPAEVKCDTVSHLENLPAEVKCDTVSHLEKEIA